MKRKSSFYVFTNLAISIDGKIATKERIPFSLGSKHDHQLMDQLRAGADVVIMGAGTLRVHKKFILVKSKSNVTKRLARGMESQPANAILTTALDLDPNMDFFKNPIRKRILFFTKKPKGKSLKFFESRCLLIQLPSGHGQARCVVDHLVRLGHKRILHEGGGASLFDFVKDDLIDEWNITLTPKIVGGRSAPTLVDGDGFTVSKIKKYKLARVKRLGSELFLRYTRPEF